MEIISSPDEWKRNWAKNQKFLIKRHVFEAKTEEQVLENVKTILSDNNLSIQSYKSFSRKTPKGFFMTLHRDYYQFNMLFFRKGVRDDTLWLKIYDEPTPQITAIWYLSSQDIDFNGGNLVFHDNEKIIPKKYKVVLFDSNDLHAVHLQGTTKTSRETMVYTFIIK